ncbi:MAG: hypothetical protein DHS80DRAFT_33437 [Piptocephalis tieghemiana]|nr:MAG: hypothetical protein DHS80DRAFT_33437 [Piptocephalis tieghemiana]
MAPPRATPKTYIFHFDPSKAAANSTYRGMIVDCISPTRLTERSTQSNSVYIHTRGCKSHPKLITSHIAEYFDQDILTLKYERNKGRFEVNLKRGVDPAKYIYQSIPVGNVALQIEKVYRADKKLATVKLSDLPLESVHELASLIENFFHKPLMTQEIMIHVITEQHLPMGTATVVLDTSEDPKALETLPRRADMEGITIQLTWKHCPFLCVYCKKAGHQRDNCPKLMARGHYGPYGLRSKLGVPPTPLIQTEAEPTLNGGSFAVPASHGKERINIPQVLSLNSDASSTKINENTTLTLHISDPPIQVPYPPVPPGGNFRYLGVLLKKEGVNTRSMEERRLSAITKRTEGWMGRHTSLAGRVRITNMCLPSRL